MATVVPLRGLSHHVPMEQLNSPNSEIILIGTLFFILIAVACWTAFLTRARNRIIHEIKTTPQSISCCQIGKTEEGYTTYYIKFVDTHPLHTKGWIFMGTGADRKFENLIAQQRIKIVTQ